MGLSVSHDCWSGSCTAFSRFRRALARAAGMPDLGLMDGFGRSDGGLPIAWDSLRPDAVHHLLNHSDCDGVLKVEVLLPLAERLEELAQLLESDGVEGPRWADCARAFASGCRDAAAAGEQVEFS